MRVLDVIRHTVTRPRLTINENRVTVKVPKGYEIFYHKLAAVFSEMASIRTPRTIRARFKVTDSVAYLRTESGVLVHVLCVKDLFYAKDN